MTISQHKFGPTTIAKVSNSAQLKQLMVGPWLKSDTIIIKPNWVSTDPGDFTDADTLRALFETLKGRLIVTESYCILRSMNILSDGMSFSVGDKEVNWKWLRKGDGWKWLINNPDWEWFKNEGHWQNMGILSSGPLGATVDAERITALGQGPGYAYGLFNSGNAR